MFKAFDIQLINKPATGILHPTLRAWKRYYHSHHSLLKIIYNYAGKQT